TDLRMLPLPKRKSERRPADPVRRKQARIPRRHVNLRGTEGNDSMRNRSRWLVLSAILATAASPALAQGQPIDAARLEAANQSPNDWLTYHGSYKSFHFSGLDQINPDTIKNLEVPWMHFPGRTTRGLQSMPLAADGVLYYSGSYSRVFALDGATGKVLWSYIPELNEDLIAQQTHSPYNRGIALGDGKLYVGTV